MPSTRDPRQVLKEARQIAHDHGCFVSEKKEGNGTTYLLYRKTEPPTYVGKRSSIQGLHSMVCKACNFH
ncbi:hypothetical protein METUNv1_00516 [Methyloversatilis universalis FAM5]|uniref:Uncharacterized protein n=1 Tax=Methyloversatilis universalis (strain ATCC BAA-1314 / DSM 25237 / JCM 13912 / CCUG 52030 / FAM5) TaxID=1000565 RepID=F5R880_METUF|nr:hypothetical protein [Methyloversatilis universalis]EGK73338.1 hypothetical protein METUNv1_00516 [Methyloversatilis universalis FAM5]